MKKFILLSCYPVILLIIFSLALRVNHIAAQEATEPAQATGFAPMR